MHRVHQSTARKCQLRPRRTHLLCSALIALSAALTSCAPAARQPAAQQPAAQQPATAPTPQAAVLRLLDITPRDGSRVDSSTTMVARLAYVIPDFDPERRYVVSALFAQVGGRLSSIGSQHIALQAPFGIVTVRHPIFDSASAMPSEPVRPVTGVFYLMEQGSTVAIADTVVLGDTMRVLVASRSTVHARSRTFFYNGSGPARSLAVGLPALLEEYWTYRPRKALAIAYDSAERWTYGYATGHRSDSAAVARAMTECKTAAARRQVTAPCQLVVSSDSDAR